MKRRFFKALVSALLLLSISVNLFACSLGVSADDLMDGVSPRAVLRADDMSRGNFAAACFAVKLLQENISSGENTLLSPLSIMSALAMTANGARENTLLEMEGVLGLGIDELNAYLYTYLSSLPQGEKYKLAVANSIWFNNAADFSVNEGFLQLNADYYGADIYSAPFNKSTVKDINNWVRRGTDGMINKIIENIPDHALMYLVNTVAFEAEWQKIYEKKDVRDGEFTNADGSTATVDYMYSDEGKYLEDEYASGFIKYYNGRKYAFVALLPNENIDIYEYIESLDGERLYNMLANAQNQAVDAAIPKFDAAYDVELTEALKNMGMADAFDNDSSDFSGVGSFTYEGTEKNIYIGGVSHKTYISVGERGTRAGAVTVIGLAGSAVGPDEIKTVHLTRPFVYMLIDTENCVPFFIGALTDISK